MGRHSRLAGAKYQGITGMEDLSSKIVGGKSHGWLIIKYCREPPLNLFKNITQELYSLL